MENSNVKIKYGVLHCHTENSTKDSAMSARTLVETAKNLGAPAVALTDHGVLTGVFEFMQSCEALNIKGIPGVEAYIEEDKVVSKRSHLILLPKDYVGYTAISKAVTRSNDRIANGFPRMNKEILEEFFKEGSPGHSHVIATSACMQGVLSSILLKNKTVETEIEKAKSRLEKYSDPDDPSYKANKELLDKTSKTIKDLMEERDNLAKLASKKFSMKEKTLATLSKKEDLSEYHLFKENLEKEKKESKEAEEKLAKIKSDIAKEKKRESQIRKHLKEVEGTHDKYREISKTISEMRKEVKDSEALYKEALDEADYYINLFGKGNFYIELQYHGINDEKTVMPLLAKIAEDKDIPLCAANDVHTPDKTPDSIRARRIVNSLRFNRWEDERVGDDELYMKTDSELKEALLKILPSDTVERAMLGIEKIVSSCDVIFPSDKHYPRFLDEKGCTVDTKKRLREIAEKNIALKYPGPLWTKELQDRLEYELDIIDKSGYNDYLCIVEDFLNYGRKLGKDNPENVGLGVGSGRGSAAGSLVCYLAGITGIDPIKYDLIFERFLNLERVSSPDIDSDFKTDDRDKVLDYVKEKYGENAVCNIMTKGTLGAKAAIRSAARILGDARYGNTKALLNVGDEISRVLPQKPDTKLSDYEEALSEFKTPDAKQIIEDAKLIEGVTVQYGMHAAGVIIADNGDVSDYIPLMRNKEGEPLVCQCSMVEAEENAGLLKFDFLGLRNLNIITDTLRIIKRVHGKAIDIEEVGRSLHDGRTTPFDLPGKNVFDEIFAKGKTNSVFQFESGGMKSMLRRFKPSNIDDIILLVAAYRPGPMQYLDDIIAVKHKTKKPVYVVPEMEEILAKTYGYPVYQEQIMQIFNQVAGFTLGEADQIRRAMSKKKLDKFTAHKEKFLKGLQDKGATKKSAEDFWVELMAFAQYAFNKSHAAAYAMVAFYTAWLKLNYPAEYMTAVLNHTPQNKLPLMVAECEALGVTVLPPDINKSEEAFTYIDGKVLFGLGSIKNVGKAIESLVNERTKEPFRSFKDFVKRGHSKKDVTESLIDAGALDRWCDNRKAMKTVLESLVKDWKQVEDKEQKLALEKDEKKRNLIEKKLDQYKLRFNQTILPIELPESTLERLEKEKELVGMYITGHPLNEYEGLSDGTPISDAEPGTISFSGVIKDLRYAKRKQDGRTMAFFKLEDKTGEIDVACFTKAYSEYGKMILEGNVVKIVGLCKETDDSTEEEKIYMIYANEIKLLPRKLQKVMISVKDLGEYAETVYPMLEAYKGNDYEVIIHDQMLGELRKTNLKVSERLLGAFIKGAEVKIYDGEN